MTKRRLFLDFDDVYKNQEIPQDYIVLTSDYKRKGVINVLENIGCRSKAYDDYTQIVECFHLRGAQNQGMVLFLNFFYPLTQWLDQIETLLENGVINKDTNVVFSSFSNNRKVSLVEAEGEVNSKFMYKRSYFLSSYILDFLKVNGFCRIEIQREVTLKSKVLFRLRGIMMISVKVALILFYKLFVFNRVKGPLKKGGSREVVAVLTRGVVQTQFMSGIVNLFGEKAIIIANEASMNPFRNRDLLKSLGNDFFYAEGNLTYKELFLSLARVVSFYWKRTNIESTYYGVCVRFDDLKPEFGCYDLHMGSYAYSVSNSIIKFENRYNVSIRRLVSFEMLFPFSGYLKEKIGKSIIQIQTVGLYNGSYPDFVFSDRFYFTNKNNYQYHLNSSTAKKSYGLLNNLKYADLKRIERKDEFIKWTFFNQPVYEEEELEMLSFLIRYCKENEIELKLKLHPRSKLSLYEKLDIVTIPTTISSQEAVASSDLVITRTSAIGMDAWYLNIPILFFTYGTIKSQEMAFIPEDYCGNIKNEIDDFSLFGNVVDQAVEEFYSHDFQALVTVDSEQIKNEIWG